MSHPTVEQVILAIINLMLCLPIMVISICRLNAMMNVERRRNVRLIVKCEYVLWLSSAFYSSFSAWVNEWPSYARLFISAAILVYMIASSKAWAHDKPPFIATRSGDLQ